MNFSDYRQARYDRIQQQLEQALPRKTEQPMHLHTAMRYAVLNGGKRLRPLLVYAAGEALGADVSVLDAPALAIEYIHAYSLVHDDLPAMDNDDLRRGQPTCHKAFDEATAILVGDALQVLAFEQLSNACGLSDATRIAMIAVLAKASGSRGMVGGQSLDLQSQIPLATPAALETLYTLKTGALLSASVELGLLASEKITPALREQARAYTKPLGLAFQIRDDILDIEGSLETLGKLPGSDQRQQKSTYAALVGIEAAKARVRALREEAYQALALWNSENSPLWQLTRAMIGE